MTKHYIRLDGKFVTKTFTDDFELPIEGDVCVNEDGGRHFNLVLFNEDDLPALKYVNKKIVPTTERDLAPLKQSQEEVETIEQRLVKVEQEVATLKTTRLTR